MKTNPIQEKMSKDEKMQELVRETIKYSISKGYLLTYVVKAITQLWRDEFFEKEESCVIDDFSEDEKAFFKKVESFMKYYDADLAKERLNSKLYFNFICAMYCAFNRRKGKDKILNKDFIDFYRSHFEEHFREASLRYEFSSLRSFVDKLDFKDIESTGKPVVFYPNKTVVHFEDRFPFFNFRRYCRDQKINMDYGICARNLIVGCDLIYIINTFF